MCEEARSSSTADHPTSRPLAWLGRVRNSLVGTWSILIAIGAIGGLLGLVEKGWRIFSVDTVPQISAPELGSDPFSLPVSIKNLSSVFSLTDVQISCSTSQDSRKQFKRAANPTNGGSDKEGKIRWAGEGLAAYPNAKILPNETILVACPFGDPKFDATLTSNINYTVLGFWHRSQQASFTWLAASSPPHWRSGKGIGYDN